MDKKYVFEKCVILKTEENKIQVKRIDEIPNDLENIEKTFNFALNVFRAIYFYEFYIKKQIKINSTKSTK